MNWMLRTKGLSISLRCTRFLSHHCQLYFTQPIRMSFFPRNCVYSQAKQLFRQLHVKSNISGLICSTATSSHRQTSFIPNPSSEQNVWLGGKYILCAKNPSLKSCSGRQIPNTLSKLGYSCTFCMSTSSNLPSKFSIQNPAYASYLQSLVKEFQAIQGASTDSTSSFSSDGNQQSQWSRFNFLQAAVTVVEHVQTKHQEISELLDFLKGEKDPEMKKMMETEVERYRNDLQKTEKELVDILAGDDPADNSDIMLEVTAGVGGQEAMLFCQEVFNMYCNYAMRKGWRLVEPASDTSELGGARKARVEITGDGVYKQLKHEGGVHRVQRIPRTEKAGRIHTSTITVSILPQPREIDIDIQQKDLKIETFRNSGPGGQSVNTTDSAVRITHIPTGTVAEGKEERSQIKNKDIALKKLKQRIYETILEKQQGKIRASRKLQQGTRARSEKIRSYNFQKDRVTDHRTRESISNLAQLMAVGGEGLDGLIEGLVQQERYHTLDMMLEGWEEVEGKEKRR